jgi:hypothetical protein
MKHTATQALMTIAIAVALAVAVVVAARAEDPRFVWPKNDQFTCRGELIRDDYKVLQLARNARNLTWCDAEIADHLEAKVLKVCVVGSLCEIKGSIQGHGAFAWVKITKVRRGE